jgi:hypothetical protein
MKVPIVGGPPVPIVVSQGLPLAIAVDAAYAYWTDRYLGTITKVPIGGGDVIPLATGQPNPKGIAIGAAAVYWTNRDDGTLMKLAFGTTTPITLDSDATAWGMGVTIDLTSVYWIRQGNSGSGYGALAKVPLDGGPRTPIIGGQYGPTNVVVDATSVYWTNADAGTIMRAPLTGGVVPDTLASGQDLPDGIAINATGIYWTNAGRSTGTGSVMKMEKH